MTTTKRVILVGLIGGIASGKSTVARMLQQRGGLWLDSDRMAHEELNSPEAIAELRARFGDEVLKSDGQVDRKKLGSLVFGEDERAQNNKRWLEQLIHPRVRARTEQQIATVGSQYRFAVVDAPLLIEAGWADRCDFILMVDAPIDLRRQWAAGRGWNTEELSKREAGQLPLDEKRRRATHVIENDGSLEDLEAQVESFVEQLQSRP